jgi:hypothetical protein
MYVTTDRDPTAYRAEMLLGHTERRARFLATVLLHSGVFMGRHYAAFAGITHGQKVHDFVERLLAARFATAFRLGRTGRTRIFHVRHKRLYSAIGEPDNRNRKPVSLGRAIERMMVLDAVLADRDIVWLGAERDKLRHFFLHVPCKRLNKDEYARLAFGKGIEKTFRYFPDKLPIGVDEQNDRYVFVFLATDHTPMDFRQFLLRHAELLTALHRWTIRIVFPRERADLRSTYEAVVYDQLARPLPIWFTDALVVNFRRRRDGQPPLQMDREWSRLDPAKPSGPALSALYRRWLDDGDRAIFRAGSFTIRDAFERGRGQVECLVLAHPYAHLSSLAGTS